MMSRRRNVFLMVQRQLLIALINQQFLCYGTWATRTPALPAPPLPMAAALNATHTATPPPPPLTPTHNKQQQQPHYYEHQLVDRGDHRSDHGDRVDRRVDHDERGGKNCLNAQKKNCYRIVSIETNCTRDHFEMRLHLNSDFRGVLYAKDFPLECRARGTAQPNITLRLPTSGCGVRVEPRPGSGSGAGTGPQMEFSVRVMLQTEQKLRQSSDILRTIRCKLPMNAMGMTVLPAGYAHSTKLKAATHNKFKYNQRNGRMRTFAAPASTATSNTGPNAVNDNDNAAITASKAEEATEHADKDNPSEETSADSTAQANNKNAAPTTSTTTTSSSSLTSTSTSTTITTPRVRIWLELGGGDGSGSVELGEPTKLTVRAIVPGYMGVRVVDCAALDGLGESSQQLLDERGCPIDEQVMPALNTRFKPAEEGWSKLHEDDLVEKTFAATFPAFKFPDRERLHVSCGVQLCKGKCPNVNCRSAEKLDLSGDKHLARIEVFNSLAVTAPQIEVDRLTYDRRYNMSVEEYPPYVRRLPSEGTLCLSVSKLAISFCTLGLIFLIAVIVAIYSLLRSRRRGRQCTRRCVAASLVGGGGGGGGSGENTVNRLHRTELCTSMFSSSSDSAQSARFSSKLFMPYYPNTLPYGRVY